MPGPFDYAGAFGGEQSPLQAFTQGLQSGNAMQQIQLAEQQRQLQLQQAQAAQQRQQAMQSMAAQVAQNPTPQAIAQLSIAFPEISEHVKRSYDMMAPEQQQQRLQMATPIYSAVLSGQNDVASKLLRDNATALDNSGDKQQAQAMRTYADLVDTHPESAKMIIGTMLSGVMGPDKFATTFAGLGKEGRDAALAPVELELKTAEAKKAGAEAAGAPEKVSLTNQELKEKIETAQAQRRIAELETQIKQANSETERGKLILERDKLQGELSQKQQTKLQSAQDASDSATMALNTIKQIKEHPGLRNYGKSWMMRNLSSDLSEPGTTTRKILAWFPGTQSKDLENLVGTLKSQSFLSAVQQMKGMGSLSDAEGKKLDSSIASLDLDQSLPQFMSSLTTIEGLLNKNQSKLNARGLPTAKGTEAFVAKIPGIGDVRESDINRLMAQNPGTTREQVMEYLKSKGGK